MTVDDLASFMRTSELRLVREGFYSNSYGQRGYFAEYQCSGMFLKYSISSTDFAFAPDEVSMAITAARRWIQRANPYSNKNGQIGLEATVHSAGHAFMLTATPIA
jgi:hypothetical protein